MLYTHDISDSKMFKLKKSNILPSGEKVILFYDDTIFDTCQKGIILTEKRIIIFDKNTKIEYNNSKVTDITVKEIDRDNYIFKLYITDKNNIEKDITPKSIPNDEMKLLCMLLNNYLREHREKHK